MSSKEKLKSIALSALAIVAIFILAPLLMLVIAIAILCREPRIVVGIALALLLVTAITLAAGGVGIAEQLAIYAYFFLASGVILLLIKYLREKGKKGEEKESIG